MNGDTNPAIQGFMIAVNELDYQTVVDAPTRNICNAAFEATIGAPWWTCENIQLTGTVSAVTARVGDTVTIPVGIQALPAEFAFEQLGFSVQAWVCYPNTVPGGAGMTDSNLVVPSMKSNGFASFSDPSTSSAPAVYNGMLGSGVSYQQASGPTPSFRWISLTPWTPTEEDFMDQGEDGGHCCMIANASGAFDFNSESGFFASPVGEQIVADSELASYIDVCTDLYQGQRNIVIVPASSGKRRLPPKFGFLSGAPRQMTSSKTTVTVTAINQGDHVDPLLLKVLQTGPYHGLPLKPASSPPRSLRLARHDCAWNSWLCKIICEAEEIIEELLGLDLHPFGGGHRLHLSLPAHGLQPLSLEAELAPSEPPGTVHSIEITQTDANGARGGIRVGIVVT
jgi:hypothetical protein